MTPRDWTWRSEGRGEEMGTVGVQSPQQAIVCRAMDETGGLDLERRVKICS